jgi:hypothetical protein
MRDDDSSNAGRDDGPGFRRTYAQGTVETSVPGDAEELAPRLRQNDVDELRFYEGQSPHEALLASFNNAKICLSLKDREGRMAAMFGVGWTGNPRVGRVWLLSSEYLYEIGRPFLLECPKYIDMFMAGHDVLYNHVHDRNQASIEWLTWLGFEVTATFPEYGEHKQPFAEYCLFRDSETRDIYLHRRWPAATPMSRFGE